MKYIPKPEDFHQEERKAKLLENDELQSVLEKMPQKRANLVIATLLNPTDSKFEIAKKAGYKVAEGSKPNHLFKAIEGKLGKSLLQLGITEADILKTLCECRSAYKVIPIKTTKKTIDKDGNTTIITTTELVEIPDSPVRLKTVEMLMKLGDYFPAQKLNINQKSTHEHKFAENMSLKDMRAKELEHAQNDEIPPDYEVTDERVN